MKKDVKQRLLEKIVINKESGCWNWIGAKSVNRKWVYGLFLFEGKLRPSHRVSYTIFKGKIPDGLEMDHLCRNTLCVNPNHVEPVTHKENIRRGYALKELVTHCAHGHQYDDENTYWKKRPGGTITRECRICRKEQLIVHYAKKKAKKL